MNDRTVEIIEFGPTDRVRVDYDDCPQNPRTDWDCHLTGAVTVEQRRNQIDVEPVHVDTIGIAEAHERLIETVSLHSGAMSASYTVPSPELVTRWARIFHDVTVDWDSEHGCYWFVDPAKYEENWPGGEWVHEHLGLGGTPPRTFATKADWEREIIKGEQETYNQWAQGEVYILTHEKLASYQRVENVGYHPSTEPDLQIWEEVEDTGSIGGFYWSDGYEARQAALESFDLPQPVVQPS